jgi:hypothetical protein
MVTKYGAAGNDVSLFEGGALDALETLAGGSKQAQQAMALTRALTPERQEFDPAIAALRYFTTMASEASKPGATVLGSAASAFASPAEYIQQVRDYNRKLDAAQGQTAISLASALKPPKTTVGGLTTKSYTLQKDVEGVGKKGQTVTLTNAAASKIINADPASLVEFTKTTAGKPTKPYTVEILDDTAFAAAFPGVALPTDKKIDLTNAQVALLPAGSFSITDTTTSSIGTPKAYSVSEENLAALNEALGTNLQRDTLGNVVLTPDQFAKGQNFLGAAAGKPPQGSEYERMFSIVNDIGTRLADPTLKDSVTQAEINEYSAKYQKLVVGGEFTETVDGKLVTRKKPGIDLSSTTNLPIPEGLDLNKIIEQKTQKFDQNQSTAATFGSRMLYNEGVLRNSLAEGYVVTVADLAQIAARQKLGLGNIGADPLAIQFHVAAQNWVAAQLRRESGAAIGPKEYSDALLQYFPQVGDSADVLRQKQALRDEVTRGMINSSGDAFGVVYPDASKYLKYTSDGQEYDILNPQGYANELISKAELGQNLFFKDTIAGKTTQQLKDMLANPNAGNLYTSQMLEIIKDEIQGRSE